jgi:hypothetical protein
MYKPSKNPKIEELTKSCKDRSICLDTLKVIPSLEGKRFCVWCTEKQLHHGNQKYCSQECSKSAMAWAYPQKEEGLFFLLHRQDWKCNTCDYSWKSLANDIHNSLYLSYKTWGKHPHEFGSKFDWGLITRLKSKCYNTNRRPEVDHITPIYKGGQSIGLENHQAICTLCHRTKTGKDLSGKRDK